MEKRHIARRSAEDFFFYHTKTLISQTESDYCKTVNISELLTYQKHLFLKKHTSFIVKLGQKI